jgi:hypothetical protein
MLHGPWKEASAAIVTLQIDDNNVNDEAIAIALAYLYGNHPKLNDNNAFRVLAAASFLDLQVCCHFYSFNVIFRFCTCNLILRFYNVFYLVYQCICVGFMCYMYRFHNI